MTLPGLSQRILHSAWRILLPGLALAIVLIAVLIYTRLRIGEERFLLESMQTAARLEREQSRLIQRFDQVSQELMRKLAQEVQHRWRYAVDSEGDSQIRLAQAALLPLNRVEKVLQSRIKELHEDYYGIQVYGFEQALKALQRNQRVDYASIANHLHTASADGIEGLEASMVDALVHMLFSHVHASGLSRPVEQALQSAFQFEPARAEGQPLAFRFFNATPRFIYRRIPVSKVVHPKLRNRLFSASQLQSPLAASGLCIMVLKEKAFFRYRLNLEAKKYGGRLIPLRDSKSLMTPKGFEPPQQDIRQTLLRGENRVFHAKGQEGKVWLVAAFRDSTTRSQLWWFASPLHKVRQAELKEPVLWILSGLVLLILLILFLRHLSNALAAPLQSLSQRIRSEALALDRHTIAVSSGLDVGGLQKDYLETSIMGRQLQKALSQAQERLRLMQLLSELRYVSARFQGPEFESKADRILEEAFAQQNRDVRLSFEEEIHWNRERSRMQSSQRQAVREERELSIASMIQTSLMPKEMLLIPQTDVQAFFRPARYLGGDFYDCFEASSRVWLVMADVSGKGLAAALYGSIVRALIRSIATQETSPAMILQKTNAILCQRADMEFFCTVFLVCIEHDFHCCWASAGHNQMFLRHKDELQELNGRGLPLGMLHSGQWSEYEFQLKKGDEILLYTDGIPEAENQQLELFGMARFEDVCSRKELSVTEKIATLIKEVEAFTADCEQSDDWTVLIFRRQTDTDSESL